MKYLLLLILTFNVYAQDTLFLPAYNKADQIIVHLAYVLKYDVKINQASWVYYKLTSKMVKESPFERTNNFKQDPLIINPVLPKEYIGSGYDKGHLCAAADMGWSKQALDESFYMSNMSPQLPGFNRGIWKKLEMHIRNWAESSSKLYIVTGPIIKKTNSVKVNSRILVPKGFFKVILDCQDSSCNKAKAIGFIFPHSEDLKDITSFAVTVDSVEKLTKNDFFKALPDKIEKTIESKVKLEEWKIK